MEVIIFNSHFDNRSFTTFQENIFDLGMNYNASDLIVKKVLSPIELAEAVQAAIQTCVVVGMNIRENFKPIYVDFNGYLIRDWMISELGYKLILLKAPTKNPKIAQIQINLISKINLDDLMSLSELDS